MARLVRTGFDLAGESGLLEEADGVRTIRPETTLIVRPVDRLPADARAAIEEYRRELLAVVLACPIWQPTTYPVSDN